MTPRAEAGRETAAIELERGPGLAKLIDDIRRLAAEQERVVVCVGGGSSTGKTYSTEQVLQAEFGDDLLVFSTDWYYRGRDWMETHLPPELHDNFDHPDVVDLREAAEHVAALREGRPVRCPNYEFATSERGEPFLIEPKKIIMVEGLHTLGDAFQAIRPDYRVYFEASRHGRFIRRIRRDINRTGETPSGVVQRIVSTVEPMFAEHVEPTRQNADLVIRSEFSFAELTELIHRHQIKYEWLEGFVPGEKVSESTQVDRYYQPGDGSLAEGEIVRVREDRTPEGIQYTLTYKAPHDSAIGILHQEFNADVGAGDWQHLGRLYDGAVLTVEKRRRRYWIPGSERDEVTVDEVVAHTNGRTAGVGTFVEIGREGLIAPLEAAAIARRLGLDPADEVPFSYYQLAQRALGLRPRYPVE